jgi:alpha,alpha-trehalase
MKLRQPPNETLKLFDEFMQKYHNEPPKDALQDWVETHFDQPESEFEAWTPDDFSKSPAMFNKINDKNFLEFARALNGIWLKLGRKMKHDVELNNDLYSIIHVKNPVIVPGGRFREFYYWDSYWVLLGLLHCEMTNVSKTFKALRLLHSNSNFLNFSPLFIDN